MLTEMAESRRCRGSAFHEDGPDDYLLPDKHLIYLCW